MAEKFFTFPIRGEKLSMTVEVENWVHTRQTEFQRIDILDTLAFGRILLLDGHIQLATLDEFAYHEALVQMPMLSMAAPKRALVIGGGDGGVLRELVRHSSLTHIDMVEIDAGVVEASKEFLPTLSAGAFDDPRVHLHIADAFPFVKSITEPYDLIVADSTDVYEGEDGNLSEMLFTQGFYEDCKRALSKDGFLVTQADNIVFCPYSVESILELFGKVFPKVGHYAGMVPSFGGYSGYAWASHGATIRPDLERAKSLGLRYLNPATIGLAEANWPF
ncbi:MAG: polyamine aminopropyltransferase [Armatimonadetes bacterium]|nr:polyamine aminopropyltransferase [Armatimonadota bacterium]